MFHSKTSILFLQNVNPTSFPMSYDFVMNCEILVFQLVNYEIMRNRTYGRGNRDGISNSADNTYILALTIETAKLIMRCKYSVTYLRMC